jgi:hypothetical protein
MMEGLRIDTESKGPSPHIPKYTFKNSLDSRVSIVVTGPFEGSFDFSFDKLTFSIKNGSLTSPTSSTMICKDAAHCNYTIEDSQILIETGEITLNFQWMCEEPSKYIFCCNYMATENVEVRQHQSDDFPCVILQIGKLFITKKHCWVGCISTECDFSKEYIIEHWG